MAIYHLEQLGANRIVTAITMFFAISIVNALEFDDWVVTEECRKDANILCHGYYRQPDYPAVLPNKSYPVHITSDEASLVAKGTSEFTGNVKATQGDKIIYADKALVVHDEATGSLERITLTGNVKIMQPGIRVDGIQGVAYVGSARKTIDNAVYRMYDSHARGTSKFVEVLENDCMILQDATYTTCAPCSNAWHLHANKSRFNRITGRGEAWHSFLYVKDFPVFYYPYVNFPIDKRRQSGFLQPEFENSSQNGATFIAPYYWNIAPNFDSLVRPQYMTKRSWKFDVNFRYLTHVNDGEFNFNFLPHDREYAALRSRQYSNRDFMQSNSPGDVLRRNDLKPRDFRYSFNATNNTRLNKNMTFNLNYTCASDGNYFYDFSDDPTAQIYARQEASLTHASFFGTTKLTVQQYQTFHVIDGPSAKEQLAKMPELDFRSTRCDLHSNFSTAATASYTNFRPKNLWQNPDPLSFGQRIHARPELAYNLIEPGWFFKPRVQLNYVGYSDLWISPQDQAKGIQQGSASKGIPMYDVDGGLIFERTMQNNMVQTLEPRLYYLYVPDVNQSHLPRFDSGLMTFDYNQVFRDNRYTGLDRVSEANQIGMGLASKFYDSYGNEVVMLGVGQIYYFRNVILRLDNELDFTYRKWSPFTAVGRFNFSPEYSLNANYVLFQNYPDTVSVHLQYKADKYKVFNIGYEQAHSPYPDDLTGAYNEDVRQFNISTGWQVTTPIRVLGKFNYDIRFKRNIETMVGIEYHTCCTAIRFLWSRVWEANTFNEDSHRHRFYLQLILKGFAGVGNASDNWLSDTIPGYVAGPDFN